MEQHSWSLVDTGLQRRWWSFLLQVCIPVGCVPPACCPYLPAYTAHRVSAPGGGGVCSRGWGCLLPGVGGVCSRGWGCLLPGSGVSAPGGCLFQRACLLLGGSAPRGCLLLWGVSEHALRQAPPPPSLWTECHSWLKGWCLNGDGTPVSRYPARGITAKPPRQGGIHTWRWWQQWHQ